ncbi:MAG: hypothetical protein RDU20_20920 [Desulfomonilaceae bacterium]|nr:hypothetical protein [Desulfomonilaceae bacterium]
MKKLMTLASIIGGCFAYYPYYYGYYVYPAYGWAWGWGGWYY